MSTLAFERKGFLSRVATASKRASLGVGIEERVREKVNASHAKNIFFQGVMWLLFGREITESVNHTHATHEVLAAQERLASGTQAKTVGNIAVQPYYSARPKALSGDVISAPTAQQVQEVRRLTQDIPHADSNGVDSAH